MWRVGLNDVRSQIYEQFCGKRGLDFLAHARDTLLMLSQQPDLHRVKFMGRYLACLCHSGGQKEKHNAASLAMFPAWLHITGLLRVN